MRNYHLSIVAQRESRTFIAFSLELVARSENVEMNLKLKRNLEQNKSREEKSLLDQIEKKMKI